MSSVFSHISTAQANLNINLRKIMASVSKNPSSIPMRDINLNGIFVALTTPFKENQDICFDSLKSNLIKYEEIPFAGYVVSGTNGESPYLSPEERVSIVEFVRKITNKIIIGNSTLESTRATCALTTQIINAGADGVLVMPPFYYKKRITEEAIALHYTTIAETCRVPIVIYNNPVVTGIDISRNTLTKLAQHPFIRGVKDPDIRKSAVIVQDTTDYNFDVLNSSAGYLLGALLNGCSGGLNGLAGLLGKDVCDLYNFYKEGKIKEASEIQKRLSKLDTVILAEMGVPGLKAAMDMIGLIGGCCRKPDLPLNEADKQKIRKNLEDAGFL